MFVYWWNCIGGTGVNVEESEGVLAVEDTGGWGGDGRAGDCRSFVYEEVFGVCVRGGTRGNHQGVKHSACLKGGC